MRSVLLGLVFSLSLSNCGSTTFDTANVLYFEIYGVQAKPEIAPGNASPRSITLTLESIALINSDGTDEVLDTAIDEEFEIIARPWIVYEKDLLDYIGTTFAGFKATFSQTASAKGKYKIRPLELSVADRVLVKDIEIQQSQAVTVSLKLNWLHTSLVDDVLLDEVFVEPDFELSAVNGTNSTTD